MQLLHSSDICPVFYTFPGNLYFYTFRYIKMEPVTRLHKTCLKLKLEETEKARRNSSLIHYFGLI